MSATEMAGSRPSPDISVLVVDDHLLLAETIVLALSQDPAFAVDSAPDLDAAVDLIARQGRYDVVLLDYSLPGSDGMTGVERMIAANGKGVVIFSGVAPLPVVERALAVGAMGFIPKTLPLKTVESAVRMIAAGEVFVPYNYVQQVLHQDNQPGNLKPREMQVLRMLCEGAQNKEIAHVLGLSEVIVKADVKAICRKLGVRNRTEAALMARETGLC